MAKSAGKSKAQEGHDVLEAAMKDEVLGKDHPPIPAIEELPDNLPPLQPINETEETQTEEQGSPEQSEVESDNQEEAALETHPGTSEGAEPEETPKPSFEQVLLDFEKWLAEGAHVSYFHLRIKQLTHDNWIVYQGSTTDRWCSLYANGRSYFQRSSLLRALLGLRGSVLEHEQRLYAFFKDFQLATGSEKR